MMLLAFLVPSTIAFADAPNPAIDRAWRAKCASCHGADGKGQTEQGKKMKVEDMSTAAWQAAITDDKIKAAITDGFKREKNGVKQEMEAYKAKLKPDQIDGLVAYVRALKK
ncbi:MAG TPA: cytochrome c [Polyangia bacterium]